MCQFIRGSADLSSEGLNNIVLFEIGTSLNKEDYASVKKDKY